MNPELNQCIFDFHFFSVRICANKSFTIIPEIKQFIVEKPRAPLIQVDVVFDSKIGKIAMGSNPAIFIPKSDQVSISSMLTQAVREFLMALSQKENFFILHAAGVAFNGKAYLFTGPSKAGKSTIAATLSNGKNILHEDSLIIHQRGDTFFASPMPDPRQPGLVNNLCLPIAGVFYIEKSAKNQITGAPNICRLMEQTRPVCSQLNSPPKIVSSFFNNCHFMCLKQNIFQKDEFINLVFFENNPRSSQPCFE